MNARIFLSSSYYGRAGKGISRAALDENNVWRTETLLPEEDVRCLAGDPGSDSVVYAGTQGNGVLRSDDAGKTWRPAGMAGHIVKSLAVSPHDSTRIFAGIKPARMYRSADSGKSWQEMLGFQRIRGRRFWLSPAERPFKAYVQSISVSPSDPQVVLAGVEFGAVVRSEDGGQTWSNHRRGAIRDCHTLCFHASNGDWAYEAGGNGASFSRDGGRNWTQLKDGLDRRYGWACAADPIDPSIWYASMSPGPGKAHSWDDARAYVFRSKGGEAWQKLAVPSEHPSNSNGVAQPLDYMPNKLLTDPKSPGHLYVGLSNGRILFSDDYGDSWRSLDFDLQGIWPDLWMGS